MSNPELEEYLLLRNIEEPIPEETFHAGAEAAVDVLEDFTDDGVEIRWLKSHVRTESAGAAVGTMCQHEVEDEATLREHADRAGHPITRVDRHGKALEGA